MIAFFLNLGDREYSKTFWNSLELVLVIRSCYAIPATAIIIKQNNNTIWKNAAKFHSY